MKFRPKYRPSAYERYREKRPLVTYVGAELTEFQQKIADKVTSGSEKFYVWAASRQSGKSFLALQLLLYFSLNFKDRVSMFVSMTYNQTEKVFNELIRAVKDSGVIASFSKKSHEVEFINHSVIYFKSYQNADACRGYHISGLLVVDEAAWIGGDDKSNDFDMIFLPMLQNHRGSKCLIISSPRGTNWFHRYYIRGQKEARLTNKSVISFHSTYEDNPFCDIDEVLSLKTTLPDAIFKQEFLAEFISGSTSAFGDAYHKCLLQYNYIDCKYNPNSRYYVGIDVGRQEDYTVATVIDSLTHRVVEVIRIRQTSFENIVSKITECIMKWKPKAVLCEVNGIGDVFYELLEKRLAEKNFYSLMPFQTTNQSKNNIIEGLKIAFENGEIFFPESDYDLCSELDAFECNYSKTAHSVVYGARNGHHDDMVMSLAIANWAVRNHLDSGNYAVI